MKPLLQHEAAECGLACLGMIANFHGMRLSLQEMRRRFPMSLKGARLDSLIRVSQALGMKSRPLRLELESLGGLTMPCVLHWDLNHFVVLTKVTRSRISIVDPASGPHDLTWDQVSGHFTGVALELTPTEKFAAGEASPVLSFRQLLGTVHGLLPGLAQILMLSLSLQVVLVATPLFMQWVVDLVLVAGDEDLLTVLGLGFGLTLVLQIVISWLRGWSVIVLSTSMGLQWMGNVVAHVLHLPLTFFERRHLGDITSRIQSVQSIQKSLTTSSVEAVIDGLMAVVTLLLMIAYSGTLASISALAVVLYLAIRAATFRSMRRRSEQQLVASARQQSHLLEALRGIQSLKISGQEAPRVAHYDNLMMETMNREVRLARWQMALHGSSQLIFGLERIAVIWVGAVLTLERVFSVGMLVAYLAYKDQFSQRMGALIDKWVEFRMLRLHAERLADIVLAQPDEVTSIASDPPLDFRIEVEALGFSYGSGAPMVLDNCSFSIAPGESVAIIGSSGSGKTTFAKLLLGLLAPTSGRILIGGKDLRRVGASTLRAMAGAVMQDDQLFAGTIAENISFFAHDCDDELVVAAAKLAAIHDEIVAMPMGYNSLIGDMHSSLSGGQKQRVLLARAFYRRPNVLVLDEATSHLDVSTEHMVNLAVKGLKLTRVIIAHRPETIASADRVLVLEGGRIVQEYRPQR